MPGALSGGIAEGFSDTFELLHGRLNEGHGELILRLCMLVNP